MNQTLAFKPLTPAQYLAYTEALAQMIAFMERFLAEAGDAGFIPEIDPLFAETGYPSARAWLQDGTQRSGNLLRLVDKHREEGDLDEYVRAVCADEVAGPLLLQLRADLQGQLTNWQQHRGLADQWGLPLPTPEDLL